MVGRSVGRSVSLWVYLSVCRLLVATVVVTGSLVHSLAQFRLSFRSAFGTFADGFEGFGKFGHPNQKQPFGADFTGAEWNRSLKRRRRTTTTTRSYATRKRISDFEAISTTYETMGTRSARRCFTGYDTLASLSRCSGIVMIWLVAFGVRRCFSLERRLLSSDSEAHRYEKLQVPKFNAVFCLEERTLFR